MGELASGLRSPKTSSSFRLLPRRGKALLTAIIAAGLLIPANTGLFKVNSQSATSTTRLPFDPVITPILLGILIWSGRRLLPKSPFDHLEVGPEGLTVRGLFGAKHFPWEAIDVFTVGSFWITRPPIVWIDVHLVPTGTHGDRVYRIGMGGYMPLFFLPFTPRTENIEDIASWLASARKAYRSDSVEDLPHFPAAIEGSVIEIGRLGV